ncbi:MAG TPA: signal peptide peptidase SppA [Pseudomonadales bacterium]
MAGTPNPLVRFSSGVLRVYRLFRSVILNLVFLFLLLVVFASLSGPPPLVIENDSALLLEPDGVIVEQLSYTNPLDSFVNEAAGATVIGEVLLQDVIDVIAIARDDARITSLILNTDKLAGGGFSHLQDIGAALRSFRESGKKVYAVGSNYTQAQYYLAAQADEVILNSFGAVGIEGFSAWQNYFSELITKLGINVHIFRVGEYKSAVEPFERMDMSPEAEENYTRLLGDLWRLYVDDVTAARNLADGQLQDIVDHQDEHLLDFDGDAGQMALQRNLVDRVESQAATRTYLVDLLGHGTELRTVDYRPYLRSQRGPAPGPASGLPVTDKVGIIVAAGNIIDGEAPRGLIGGESLSQLIRQARDDETIKALVLRIDSGGGSAFASEMIRTELEAFKGDGRPVVVSMGSVAASGGYWIATPADQIWASPSTVTGSIGIFGIYPTFENSFAKLGIGTDGVGTTELAGYMTIGRPLTPLAERSLQLTVENGYERFLDLVSASRNMTVEAVDAVAQGRVWSGEAALELGLIDQLGSLDEAVAAAAELAGIDSYDRLVIEQAMTPAQLFLQQLADNTLLGPPLLSLAVSLHDAAPIERLLAGLQRELRDLLHLNDPNALYLKCLECAAPLR